MRAVRHHTQDKWVLLYIERWLRAPVQRCDGTLQARTRGTPQGGVVSPLLANLFLHYAFDGWMQRYYPHIPFERYADDGLCHCRSRRQAEHLKAELERRFAECGLELHPKKTRIVYCKDDDRRQAYPDIAFDFLGYTFRPRRSKNRWGKPFINFSPAISNTAAKAIRQEVRGWKLHLRSDKDLDDLARMFNAVIRGWVSYYGAYYKSGLYATLRHLDRKLVRWATRKFKHLRRHKKGVARVKRRTARKKQQAACRRIKDWIKLNRHLSGGEFFRRLNARLRGHYNYYGIRGNSRSLFCFYRWAIACAFKWLNRRSWRRSYTWEQFKRVLEFVSIARPRITEVTRLRVFA